MLGPPRARSIACTGASPRWGAVFPQSAHSLPPDSASSASGESSQEAVVNTAAPPPPQPSVADFARALELPSIRKVSGGAKVGFFHDFCDGVEEGELGVEGAGTLAFEEGTGLCTPRVMIARLYLYDIFECECCTVVQRGGTPKSARWHWRLSFQGGDTLTHAVKWMI